MLLGMTAALAEPAEAEATEAAALQPGDELCGFRVTEAYESSLLNSTIYTFDHVVSGAKLVYVANEDPEVAFSIGYHTPYVDETDTNHVFEHVILAGSEKYPSTNVYMDMDSRTYSTYINAHTGQTITYYPISSLSQEQLLKMMDVYMSCMVAPVVLEDENYFKREAIRFELDDPEGEIAVNGTVYVEDLGFLTDSGDNVCAHVLDALYPNEIASNMIGLAYQHYDDLTYEHTLETYDRCYHFDNSLIVLYGDLDLERFLSFLDGEYLSKYPAEGTDLSAWTDGPTAAGFVDVQRQIPAYEGDTVDRASVINYAIDLEGASDTELYQYDLTASLMNMVGSPLYNLCIERGIESPVDAGVSVNGAKPFFYFKMDYANPEQKDELIALAQDALAEVARNGIDPAKLDTVLKAQQRNSRLLRGREAGARLPEPVGAQRRSERLSRLRSGSPGDARGRPAAAGARHGAEPADAEAQRAGDQRAHPGPRRTVRRAAYEASRGQKGLDVAGGSGRDGRGDRRLQRMERFGTAQQRFHDLARRPAGACRKRMDARAVGRRDRLQGQGRRRGRGQVRRLL